MTRPSTGTVRVLLARSGNQCAFRTCVEPITDLASGVITGEVAHIKADSPGGPRFDPDQSDEERHGFDNLVILCPPHHKIVDLNPATYTVEVLRRLKAEHESKQHQSTVVVLTPAAFENLQLAEESDRSRFDEQAREIVLGAGRADPHKIPLSDGFFFCEMHPDRFAARRFSIEQQERALDVTPQRFYSPRFLPNGKASFVTGDGWRTTLPDDAKGAGAEHAWVLRASGFFAFSEILYSVEKGAKDETGRQIINPVEVTCRLQRMVAFLIVLYQQLGLQTNEGVTMRIRLPGMSGGLLLPLDPMKRFGWLGPYVCRDHVIEHEQTHALQEWNNGSVEHIVAAARDLFLRFQWRRNSDAAVRAWLAELAERE